MTVYMCFGLIIHFHWSIVLTMITFLTISGLFSRNKSFFCLIDLLSTIQYYCLTPTLAVIRLLVDWFAVWLFDWLTDYVFDGLIGWVDYLISVSAELLKSDYLGFAAFMTARGEAAVKAKGAANGAG